MRRGACSVLVMLAMAGITLAALSARAAGKANVDDGKKHPGRDFFADPKARVFQMELSPNAVQALRIAPRKYVHGTIREGTRVWTNVAIHLKGNGSFRTVDEKPSFAVKFDEFESKQDYFGLTKLMFNNAAQDPTYLAEFLATGLFRDAGLPAARVTHCRIQMNGRDLGLYVAIEGMNKRFLKQFFSSAKGNLYEGYLQDIDSRLDQDNGDDTTQADLRALAAACGIGDSVTRLSRVGQLLDIDKFRSFVAMEMLTAHWDGYANHTNNYRLYHDPARDKMVFIAHGLDWAFRRPNVSLKPPLKSIVGRAVLQTDEQQRLFRQRIGLLYTNVFKVPVILERADAALARIRSAGLDAGTMAKIEKNAAIMRERIGLRDKSVAEELAGIPPSPPKFDETGIAQVSGWREESDRGEPLLDQPEYDGRPTLHIRAENGRSRASWRTQVYLNHGRYRMEAAVASKGLVGGSAGLRISGGQRNSGVAGTSTWRTMQNEFEVADDGLDVEFVCDFYGTAGEVWFDLNSFRVQRLSQ